MQLDDFASMQINGQEITELRIDDVLVWKKNTISNDLMLSFTGSNFSIDSASEGLTGQDIVIDWGDGATTNYTGVSDLNHTYSTSGDYSIKISGVISIGTSCFRSCSGLSSVVIPNNVISLGDYCFKSCSSLTSVIIPDTVSSIGASCFRGCSDLTNVIIPEGVISITSYCFEGCSSLTNVVFSGTVTSLGDYCFSNTGLTSVVIPDTVTNLGYYCFYNCSGLTSVIIPDTVISLKSSCFKGCSSLETLVLNWTTNPPTYNSLWITGTSSSFKFSIPYGTTSIYTDAGYPSDKLEERENPTLTLSTENEIISQYTEGDLNEFAILNITLTGNDKSHKNIIIKANGTQIDTVQTNNNGFATYVYNSEGNGEIEFTAEYEDLISNSCTIIDAKYYASNETISSAPTYNNDRTLFASDYILSEEDKVHFRFKSMPNRCIYGFGSTAGSDFVWEKVGTTLKYWRNVLTNGSYNNPSYMPSTEYDIVMEFTKYNASTYRMKLYKDDTYVDYWTCGSSIKKVRVDKFFNDDFEIEVFVL